MIEAMDEEYRRHRSEGDCSEADHARYAHYRNLTLEDPDEVWVDRTETGERHFTFVSHFRKGDERITYVVVCLTIDGAPSFIFLSFPTRDDDLVDEYRRGVDLRVGHEPEGEEPVVSNIEPVSHAGPAAAQATAHGHSELERLYGELRQAGDIPRELFDRFETYVEPTLDDPDEIWQFTDDEKNAWLIFISRHTFDAENDDGEIDEFMMITVCQPAVIEDRGGRARRGFEVVFAFPTIDPGLVQHFRKGINSLNKAFGVGWTRGRAA